MENNALDELLDSLGGYYQNQAKEDVDDITDGRFLDMCIRANHHDDVFIPLDDVLHDCMLQASHERFDDDEVSDEGQSTDDFINIIEHKTMVSSYLRGLIRNREGSMYSSDKARVVMKAVLSKSRGAHASINNDNWYEPDHGDIDAWFSVVMTYLDALESTDGMTNHIEALKRLENDETFCAENGSAS